MEYSKLGKSDLYVSKICLGGMSFGDKTKGNHAWILDQEGTDKIVKRALDLGINFFDTANCYAEGTSEIYLGNALKKYAKRKDVIIATKVYFNEGHLSHDAIIREVNGSLKRLGVDYIDLLIIHRYDYETPVEETMSALNELINEGKVRYIGASAMYAYQFLRLQECARAHGYHEFVSMQNHYNMIYREDERELYPLLKEEGVSSTPYSSLAAGRLSRPWDSDSERSKLDFIASKKYDSTKDEDMPIILREMEIAKKYNVTHTEVALSWLFSNPVVASTIVGITKEKYLDDAVNAINLKLTKEDVEYLNELYLPHKVMGARSSN
jgi:1-deoxyxylulose-5-phosphate synthase